MPVRPSAPRCSLYCCSSPRSYTKRAPFPMIPFQRPLSVSNPHVYPFFLFYQTFRTRFRQTDSPIPVIFIRHIRLPKSYRKLCSGPAYYQTIRNFDLGDALKKLFSKCFGVRMCSRSFASDWHFQTNRLELFSSTSISSWYPRLMTKTVIPQIYRKLPQNHTARLQTDEMYLQTEPRSNTQNRHSLY